MYKLLSFDVYGTLINTPPINVKAFRLILEQAGASNIDALAFYKFWESRNIVHYREPYRSYREIGELSLEEAFEHFGVVGGTANLIERYFESRRGVRAFRRRGRHGQSYRTILRIISGDAFGRADHVKFPTKPSGPEEVVIDIRYDGQPVPTCQLFEYRQHIWV
jgi:hypothetical protein